MYLLVLNSLGVSYKIQDHPQLFCYFDLSFNFISQEMQLSFYPIKLDEYEVLEYFMLGLKV